ncbi:MAG: SAM-dependent methyltransferase [Robiginitomaculum sp.]|nr:MAG: SAM-dependent methyltransferase [Robiginitomaculum sp.]
MSAVGHEVWQVNIIGSFEALKDWANEQDDQEEAPWLALSVFEEKLPEGRLQLLFVDELSASDFAQSYVPGAGFTQDCRPLVDENWIAKSLEGLPVVRAGRFYVHGAHHEVPDDPALVSILIEAGEAFGTGHHGTTKGCLLAFEDTLNTAPPASVLDLGAGAGILAMAAAIVLPRANILATDIDPIAVAVARKNAIINGVDDRIRMAVADGFAHESLKNKRFDLIFANILANPLITLAREITSALTPSATLILSGILDHQAARVRTAYEGQGVEFTREYALGEWRVLVMKPLA